jgi:hypothetical protein
VNQNEIVLHKLKAGESITAKDALQFGCFRLAARVRDLRERGVEIRTIKERNANGSYHARYVLASSAA